MPHRKGQEVSFGILEMIRSISRDASKPYRVLVALAFVLLEIIQFFSGSNWREVVLGIVAFLVLLACMFLKGRWGRILKRAYILTMLGCLIISAFIQKPFLGLLSDERMQETYYDKFAEALYRYSVGDYEKALRAFKRMKWRVPDDEKADFYYWYLDAVTRKGDEKELMQRLYEEIPEKIKNPNEKEREFIFHYLPIGRMIQYLNEGDLDKLRNMAVQYQNSGERIFALLEILALDCGRGEDVERAEKLLKELPNMQESPADFRSLENDLLFYCGSSVGMECPEFTVILWALLWEEDKNAFFDRFLLYYTREGNPLNVRFMDMEYLQGMRSFFADSWKRLKDGRPGLYDIYRQTVCNLGYYLGETDILYEEYPDKELQITKVIEGMKGEKEKISRNAMLYNIIPTGNQKFVFVILEEIHNDGWKEEDLPLIAVCAHFYDVDMEQSLGPVPIVVDGSALEQGLGMARLFVMEPTGVDGKYLVESIEGTGEYLYLYVLDLNKKSYTNIKIMETYHSKNFKYDCKSFSYKVDFEIDNRYDSNMQIKVGGTLTAALDFEQNDCTYEICYQDPALHFYVEERNDQLIFPLENLDRLQGKKIRNKTLLQKIRENSIPYYVYTKIQENISVGLFTGNLSGLYVVYDWGTQEEAAFFYLVKKKEDNVELLGIYEITDGGIKSVQ